MLAVVEPLLRLSLDRTTPILAFCSLEEELLEELREVVFSTMGGEALLSPPVTRFRTFGWPWEGLWQGLVDPGVRSTVDDGAERVLAVAGLVFCLPGNITVNYYYALPIVNNPGLCILPKIAAPHNTMHAYMQWNPSITATLGNENLAFIEG